MHMGAQRIGAGRTGHEAAWQLLESMYRQYVGGDLPSVARTDRGKPYFADSPWHFSLTHTKDHVFCVLSLGPVGIDAEETDRKINPALADKILSPGERAQYDRAEDKPLALLKFWVLKEARAKYTGEGLRGYPRDTDFSLDDPRVQIIDGCLVAVIEEEAYAV